MSLSANASSPIPASSAPLLQAEGVTVRFDACERPFDVVRDVSFTLHPGRTLCLVGESGCGKSMTALSLLRLIPEPGRLAAGRILFEGRDLAELSESAMERVRGRDIGMIFQGGALLDSSTVAENIRLPLDLFTDQSEAEKRERVDFCLRRVRLENADDLYPSELSGGMIKRVAIARAIVLNPRYLFCDEPNSGLDPQTSIVIDNLIHEITEEYNITTIINTHDMNSVMEIGQKIVYIYKGRKWWEGTKEDILHTDNRELNDFVFASAMAKRAKKAIG